MIYLEVADEISRKHLDAAVKQVDSERRRIRFVASQELTDRDGDVVVARGIDLTDFARNSVLLGDHDPSFILGKVLTGTMRVEPRAEGDALVA